MTKIYTIDAKGKRVGRVASLAATYLMGKNVVSFQRRSAPDVKVVIENATHLLISEKKKAQTKYPHFSGYQGGLRLESMEDYIERKGHREILRIAVKGMIPNNKLRPHMMKRLHIND